MNVWQFGEKADYLIAGKLTIANEGSEMMKFQTNVICTF